MSRLGFAGLAALLLLGGCHHRPAPSLQSLAAAGQIQPNAPLQAQLQVTIHASPARVWNILTDVRGWPRWNPSVTQTAAAPSVQQGSLFSWTTQGMSIHCAIERFVPDQSLAWTGKVLNYHAIHVWTLDALPNGDTEVTLRQSVSGFVIAWFYGAQALHRDDENWLQGLKRAAEAPEPQAQR
jgi:uncharacterized protein YndB with AHSA1/START domain